MSKFWRIIVVAAALAGFVSGTVLALRTFGTNDVLNYERFAIWWHYLGASMYVGVPGQIDFPPSMIYVLRFLEAMTQRTGLPFQFWLRFPGILANAGSVWILSRILSERLSDSRIAAALALLAVAPASVLLAGFHGNTDPIMMFFVLLTVWLVNRDRVWLAGAAYGLAMSVKVVPLILVPVLFFAWPSFRKKLCFFAATGVVLLAACSPFIFEEPVAIAKAIFGYRSASGWWGVTWLADALNLTDVEDFLSKHGPLLIFAGIGALSIYMSRIKPKPPLYAQVGVVFCFFLASTTGFGVQYLAWVMPWIVELGIVPMALFCLTSSVFLILVYNFWTQGTPWYFALAYPWDHLQYFQAICWLSLVAVAWCAWRACVWRAVKGREPFRLPGSPAVTAICFAAVAAALVWPMARQLQRDASSQTRPLGEDAVLSWRANAYSELSDQLSERGRFSDAEAAERESARLQALSEKLASEASRELRGKGD